MKPMVTTFSLITGVIMILGLLCLIDSYAIDRKNVLNLNETPKEKKEFSWDHCGQTFYKPSINPDGFIKRLKKRIIGGEPAIAHSWPFLASIRIKLNITKDPINEHHCGGTLITNRHVLTAAHCLFLYFKMANSLKMKLPEMFSLLEVHLGINNHNGNQNFLTSDNVYSVEFFDFHENLQVHSSILVHDIAILTLKRAVNIDRPEINFICMPDFEEEDSELKIGDKLVGVGWGAYSENFNYTSYILDGLQQAVFQVENQTGSLCNAGIIGNNWSPLDTVCARGEDGRTSTCFGDSGGPVMLYRNNRWILVGIISFAHDIIDPVTGKKRCDATMPFYFVKVSAYIDWIDRKTNFTIKNFQ